MSRYPADWVIRCDGCDEERVGQRFGPDGLYAALARGGWALGVKKDGTRARRNGKDYCPTCTARQLAARPEETRTELPRITP